MKKIGLSLVVLGIVGGTSGYFTSTTVQAESKDSTATFSLVAPENAMMLKTVPTLDFSNHSISETDSVYTATDIGTIGIADLTGTNNGWVVSVQVGEFVNTADSSKKLTGASLFYPKSIPTSQNASLDSTDIPSIIATDTDKTNTQNGLRIVAGGSDTLLIQANQGSGNGVWDLTYADQQKIQLEVPVGQLVGTYTSKVTYTLADSPIP